MKIYKTFGLLTIATAAAVWLPATAAAQGGCTTDIQCKGNRICVRGQCQNPTSSGSTPVAVAPPQTDFIADTGWTKGAAIMGFISTAVATGFGAAALGTIEEDGESVPALPLGATATVLFGVMNPIVAGGGGSGSVSGPIALRIIGWITYGFTMFNAITTVALGAAEVELGASTYRALAAGSTATGFVSGFSFALNALIASNRSSDPSYVSNDSDRPAFAPVVGRVLDRDASPVSTLGLRVEF